MTDLVTLEEFKDQVWEIEGIKIDLKPKPGQPKTLVRSYDFERLSDDSTVDDLKQRIEKCVNEPFIWYI